MDTRQSVSWSASAPAKAVSSFLSVLCGEVASSDDDSEEDAIARKERLRKLELAADIKNTQDLFSGVSLKDNQSLESMEPKAKDDFGEFQQRLVELIQAHQPYAFTLSYGYNWFST
ncbi:hypothetical protein BC937DRAFT_90507 [Endogone sp. FLAS-F59071]|nr:hypothetical protein BC937DRAFT_90507 [Endogone sp. FLAS-F59071]|eukprot:RUS17038.1 hypothetical protein BC937DRAFT_90507 [Endogone sp. FLAS-F59071]